MIPTVESRPADRTTVLAWTMIAALAAMIMVFVKASSSSPILTPNGISRPAV